MGWYLNMNKYRCPVCGAYLTREDKDGFMKCNNPYHTKELTYKKYHYDRLRGWTRND